LPAIERSRLEDPDSVVWYEDASASALITIESTSKWRSLLEPWYENSFTNLTGRIEILDGKGRFITLIDSNSGLGSFNQAEVAIDAMAPGLDLEPDKEREYQDVIYGPGLADAEECRLAELNIKRSDVLLQELVDPCGEDLDGDGDLDCR